jgi:hypothetical protein
MPNVVSTSAAATAALVLLGATPIGAAGVSSLETQTLSACFGGPVHYTQPNVGLILASARNLAPEDRARYEKIAAEAIAMTCRSGGHLVIRLIRPRNVTADLLFSANAPDTSETNPALLGSQRAGFVHDALAAARRALDEPPSVRPNTLLGAIQLTVQEMSAFDGKRVLVVDYHSWLDKQTLRYGKLAGAEDLVRLTREATQLGLTLKGVDVIVAGISADARLDATDEQYLSLCALWGRFATALRGEVVSCGRLSPEFMRIAESSVREREQLATSFAGVHPMIPSRAPIDGLRSTNGFEETSGNGSPLR